jgi:hypothetical protein
MSKKVILGLQAGSISKKKVMVVFMVEPGILRSIDCLLPTKALNVNFI